MVVLDDNDNSPSFDRHIYQGSVRADARAGDWVDLGQHAVTVTDPDLNDRVLMKVSTK